MPADDASRDQVWKDWVRRDATKPMHTQGPPPHAPQSGAVRAETYRPAPTYGPLWQKQQPFDASRSRHSLQQAQTVDSRVAAQAAAGPLLPGGRAWNNPSDNLRIYRPPPATRIIPPKQKMDALGTSTGWQSAVPPAVPTATYNPLTHNTVVVTRADAHGRGAAVAVHKGIDMYRQMSKTDLSKDVWHGRRKGVATWVDLVHPYAVNQNAEFRGGFKHEPKPYHPVTGEMSAWMNSAFESRVKNPFTGKYPQT